MSTELQKRLARSIVENATKKRSKPMNKQTMLETVGYSESVARAKATEIIEQKGTQEELAKLGFTPFDAKRVIARILHGEGTKEETKLRAADMILNVFGEYAPDKSINMNVGASDVAALIKQGMAKFRGDNTAK